MTKKPQGETPANNPEKILEINNFKKNGDGEVIQIKKSQKNKKSSKAEDVSHNEIDEEDHENHNQVLICEHALQDLFEENDWLQFELAIAQARTKTLEKVIKQMLKATGK